MYCIKKYRTIVSGDFNHSFWYKKTYLISTPYLQACSLFASTYVRHTLSSTAKSVSLAVTTAYHISTL